MELVLIGLGVFWCGWSVLYVVQTGIAHRHRRRLEQAWILVACGDDDGARTEFEAMARCRQPYLADAGRHGVAWLELTAGHYAAASGTFGELRETGHFHPSWRQSFYSEAMAICAALAGDTTTAATRLAEATHATELSPKAAALVACKRGDFEAALAIEPGEIGDHHDSRAFRLLIAFALDARGDDGVDEQVQSTSVHFPGELDYLTRDWPELREFVKRHPLPTPPADLPRARVVASRRVPPQNR